MSFWNKKFNSYLKEKLPRWQDKGWITEENSQLIWQDSESSGDGLSSSGFISYLGAIVMGIGVIAFFAANWDEMTKLSKLVILFSSMWLSYGLGGYFITSEKSVSIGQALILLGSILFGSNIMLIAQAYHIDSHFPDGVLVWSLGALTCAWLFKIPIIAILGLCLTVLWSGMESFDFTEVPHLQFFILWGLYFALIIKEKWVKTQHAAYIALAIWILWLCPGTILTGSLLSRKYLLLYFSVMLISLPGILALLTSKKMNEITYNLRFYLLIIFFIIFYLLGFEFIIEPKESRFFGFKSQIRAIPFLYSGLIFGIPAFLSMMSIYFFQKLTVKDVKNSIWVMALFSLLIGLEIMTFYGLYKPFIISALCRITMFVCLIWLAHYGYKTARKAYINLSIIFIIILLMTVYFTNMWTLMNRSLVLIGGGLLLITLSYFLDQQRKKYLNKIKAGDNK